MGIAAPLDMQDFAVANGVYLYDPVSMHPAYHFTMSARDMARFGLMMPAAANGRVSGSWRRADRAQHVAVLRRESDLELRLHGVGRETGIPWWPSHVRGPRWGRPRHRRVPRHRPAAGRSRATSGFPDRLRACRPGGGGEFRPRCVRHVPIAYSGRGLRLGPHFPAGPGPAGLAAGGRTRLGRSGGPASGNGTWPRSGRARQSEARGPIVDAIAS